MRHLQRPDWDEKALMSARIYQRAKNAMQSGKAWTDDWVFEYEPVGGAQHDPLTGWSGSADTNRQLKLRFDSLESATAYAERMGIAYHVQPTPTRRLKLQTYADNFK